MVKKTIFFFFMIFFLLAEVSAEKRILTYDTTTGKKEIKNSITISETDGILLNEEIIIQNDKMVIVNTFTSEGINAAIDVLGSEGGEVYMPEGLYDITSNIILDYGNTTLRGAGRGTILKVPDSTDTALNIISMTGLNNCTLSDFKIDGNKENNSGLQRGIYIDDGDGHRIENLWITQIDDHGIWTAGTVTDILIKGCSITYTDDDGIDFNTVRYGTIIGNYFYDIGDNGIDTDDSDWLVIANNVFHKCRAFTIELEQEGAGASQYCSVTGNVIYDARDHAIYINSGQYNTVTGNVIDTVVGSGIYLAKDAAGLSSDYNVISGNSIKSCSRYGIEEISGEADYNFISGNKLSGNTLGDYSIAGTNTNLETNLLGARKFTITHADLTDEDTSQDITLFNAAAGVRITDVYAYVATQFTGGSVSACTVAVGDSDPDGFAEEHDVLGCGDTTWILEGQNGTDKGDYLYDATVFMRAHIYTTATDVVAQFVSTNDNLANLTAGSIDIYVVCQIAQ